jgi:dolichyl-diphosphooligosaccharide---protein glycosyltransferase
LTPIVCVCAGIVVSDILTTYLDLRRPGSAEDEDITSMVEDISSSKQRRSSPTTTQNPTGIAYLKGFTYSGVFHLSSKVVVVLTFAWYLALFVRHSTYVTSTAYSSPSVVLASRLADGSQYIIDDYREAYYWLRMNTPDDARVMSWYSACSSIKG